MSKPPTPSCEQVAASKRRGFGWVAPSPLGYELKDGKLFIVEEEAERVQLIFRRYLEVSGINELVRDLRAKNICTKARTFSTGKTRGGIPFGREPSPTSSETASSLARSSTRARSCPENSRRSWTRPC